MLCTAVCLQYSVELWHFCLHSSLSVSSNLLTFYHVIGFSTSGFFQVRMQLDVHQKIPDGLQIQ